jgi:hypothetical protein
LIFVDNVQQWLLLMPQLAAEVATTIHRFTWMVGNAPLNWSSNQLFIMRP